MTGNRTRITALILLITALIIGCDRIFSTPIGKILANPRDYADKTVTISGEVTGVFGLVVIKYFVVRDKTGEIMVVTKRPLPVKGSQITVKGTVREAFSMGDEQMLVIEENEKNTNKNKGGGKNEEI